MKKVSNEYDLLSKLYKSNIIHKINSKWGEIVNNVRDFFSENSELLDLYGRIMYYEFYIKKYIDIYNISMLPEQKNIYDMIVKLLELQNKNEDYISLFSTYELSNIDNPKLIDVLKKIMVF